MKKEFKGALLVIMAAFFWGISGTAAKFMFNDKMNIFRLLNMRLNLAFALMMVLILIFDKQKLKISRYDIKYLFALGVIGIVGVQTTYYFTVATLNVSMAIFLQYLSPPIIVIYSAVFNKESLSRTIILALIISLMGSALTILGKQSIGSISMLGLATGLASAFFMSAYSIFSKTCTARLNSWTALVYALGFGALAYWFVSPPWAIWSTVSLKELVYAVYMAVFATIIPYGLYLSGLRYLSASTGSIIAMIEPVVASLSAYILINEKMTFMQILGGTLIIAAVTIINLYYVKSQNTNKELKNC